MFTYSEVLLYIMIACLLASVVLHVHDYLDRRRHRRRWAALAAERRAERAQRRAVLVWYSCGHPYQPEREGGRLLIDEQCPTCVESTLTSVASEWAQLH